jgi:hypothetical protein
MVINLGKLWLDPIPDALRV